MSSSRLDGETTPTTVRRSSAERGRSPSEGDRKHPRRDGHRPECAAYGLITPHGDRKLCRHVPRAHQLRLITPHGDRKPRHGRSPRVRRAGTHYPSWGSETRDISVAGGTAAGEPTSLPLMGIGNLATKRSPKRWRWRPNLITPHGDRKPSVFGARGSRHGATGLITPHGDRKPSWKPDHDLARRRLAELITPHGDRKRRLPAGQPWSPIFISLPLMGIGNDRHPGRSGAWRMSSLPLMGIGNSSDAPKRVPPRGRSHYPSWGSETRSARTAPGWLRAGVLITPHGDRKLARGTAASAAS